jgi:hypothetical protein
VRFSPQAAFLRSLTGEDKTIFAVCGAELAEAGKLVNLRKDIGKRIFFQICGNKPGIVWNMDAGRQRNSVAVKNQYKNSWVGHGRAVSGSEKSI